MLTKKLQHEQDFISKTIENLHLKENIKDVYKKNIKNKIFNKYLKIEHKLKKEQDDIKYKIFQQHSGYSESFLGLMERYENLQNDLNFYFLYQKDDIDFTTKCFAKLIYNIDLQNLADGLFVTSGMASISNVLNLLKIDNYSDILCTFRPYFETVEVFNYLNFNYQYINNNITKNNFDILYIDSSSPNFNEYKNLNDNVVFKCIVFDTSTLSPISSYIKEVICYANSKNIPIFLVRSNLKIDCFGFEINRLGSIVYIGNDKTIIKNLKLQTRINGTKAELNHIYPWIGNKEFYELIDKKVKRVQYINNIIKHICKLGLNKDFYSIIEFEHDIYFTITLKDKTNADTFNFSLMKELVMHVNEFVNFFKLQNFFLQYPGLSNYFDQVDKRWHYRVTPADITEYDAKIIGRILCRVFNKFTNNQKKL